MIQSPVSQRQHHRSVWDSFGKYDNGHKRGLINYGEINHGDCTVWLEENRRSHILSGERLLLLALLKDAIETAKGNARGKQKNRLQDEALAWMRNKDESWTFSFNNVCHYLGLEPDAVRRAIDQEVILNER
jgi:hypothetical protein